MAWRTTLRSAVDFKAVYAASAVGSFLDTVLPARLGEASKVGVLRVSAGSCWPGFPRAAGSLLCAHLLEAIAFSWSGRPRPPFCPSPTGLGGRWSAALRSPPARSAWPPPCTAGPAGTYLAELDGFFAEASASPRVLVHAGGILVATWIVRWLGIVLLLHALGVEVGLGAALVYMIVTGLANTAPILPGNAGVYQGAALGALAMVGEAGSKAIAVGLVAPLFASAVTAAAALAGVALYGRRFAVVSRGAFSR